MVSTSIVVESVIPLSNLTRRLSDFNFVLQFRSNDGSRFCMGSHGIQIN